jgi:hypothetical protein
LGAGLYSQAKQIPTLASAKSLFLLLNENSSHALGVSLAEKAKSNLMGYFLLFRQH